MSDQGKSWKCSVCGFVSETEEPPEKCPVCGVPQENFKPFETTPEKIEKRDEWRCMVCNYTHKGDEAPENCPVCGASREKFESIREQGVEINDSPGNKVVIVGGGIAGIAAAEEIRRISKSSEIIVISKETRYPYYRLNLTRYIAGEVNEDILPMYPESWYEENSISLKINAEVVDILPKEGALVLRDGEKIRYDKLILTAGSHPFVPPVPGASLDGVTSLRIIEDAEYILAKAKESESVVIIGGGVLGLETAGALISANKNISITLVEGFEYLMPRQLNRHGSQYLYNFLKELNINIITGTSVKELKGDNGSVKEVLLGDGSIIKADLVIFSIGVRPNRYLAKSCNLKVNQGIIVNDMMETSVPDIYAAGDIAEHRGTLYGLWNAAMFQGKIAGMNAAGKKTEFGGIPRSNTLKVLDVDMFSIGEFNACDGSCSFIENSGESDYTFFLFRDGKIEGAVLFGDTSQSALVKTAVEEKLNLPASLINNKNLDEIFRYLSKVV